MDINCRYVQIIHSNINALNTLCAEHKVDSLYVFGSVLKDSFNAQSDIDLVVKFLPVEVERYATNSFDLKEKLEHLFERPVDLLEEQAIRNPCLKAQIEEDKKVDV